VTSSPRAPVADPSDSAATEVLVRGDGDLRDAVSLAFRVQRHGWLVLGMGSWGLVITGPSLGLLGQGEYPARGVWVVACLVALGVGLLYGAVRAAVNHARLELAGDVIRLVRAPLPPSRTRGWRLRDISLVQISIRPGSFWNPDTLRGMPVAQPYQVILHRAGGGHVTMPLALGLEDARAVAAWIERQRVTCRGSHPERRAATRPPAP